MAQVIVTTLPPGSEIPSQDTFVMGDAIRISHGVLEVLDRGLVIKAYAPGAWIDAAVEKTRWFA